MQDPNSQQPCRFFRPDRLLLHLPCQERRSLVPDALIKFRAAAASIKFLPLLTVFVFQFFPGHKLIFYIRILIIPLLAISR